jgi:hypothetical protein
MKKSNLIGLLALGGLGALGYYFSKNKKNKSVEAPEVLDTKTPSKAISSTNVKKKLVKNSYPKPKTKNVRSIKQITPTAPETISNWSGNNNMPIPQTVRPIFSNISEKIENALSPLGIAKSNVDLKCTLPLNGWGKNVVSYYMNEAPYKYEFISLILNPEVKESSSKTSGNFAKDNCGNIYISRWQSAVVPSNKRLKDGFNTEYIRGLVWKDTDKITYFSKNQMLYLIPYQLIDEYRNKYLFPLEEYLKRLPKIDTTEEAEKAFTYPENGIWQTKPRGFGNPNDPPRWDYNLADAMSLNRNNSNYDGVRFLILNPNVRNKLGAYIDQFGNLIDKYNQALVSAHVLAEYRINNNIAF